MRSQGEGLAAALSPAICRGQRRGLQVWPGSGGVGRCGRGPATGLGGVAGVRRRGWQVWPGSGDGVRRCGRGPATGSAGVAGSGDMWGCGGVVTGWRVCMDWVGMSGDVARILIIVWLDQVMLTQILGFWRCFRLFIATTYPKYLPDQIFFKKYTNIGNLVCIRDMGCFRRYEGMFI